MLWNPTRDWGLPIYRSNKSLLSIWEQVDKILSSRREKDLAALLHLIYVSQWGQPTSAIQDGYSHLCPFLITLFYFHARQHLSFSLLRESSRTHFKAFILNHLFLVTSHPKNYLSINLCNPADWNAFQVSKVYLQIGLCSMFQHPGNQGWNKWLRASSKDL